jgi:hypothetical protein
MLMAVSTSSRAVWATGGLNRCTHRWMVNVVDLDAALGEQLVDVAVGQAEAHVPADRKDDDLGREAEAGKGGAHDGSRARAAAGIHASSVAASTR